MPDLPFETLAVQPISGDLPAGEDARYEPEYACILEEIEKLSFSGQGTPVSWTAVEKNAFVLLADKSKDLQIASYLGVALWHNHGLDGLVYGIRVLVGLLENFWESGWPALKRMRGRVNAIDWWHERTYAFLQEQGSTAIPVPAVQHRELLELLGKLDELVAALMPDASPLRDLLAATGRLTVAPEVVAEPATPEPPAEQHTTEQATPAVAPVKAPEQAPQPVPPEQQPAPAPASVSAPAQPAQQAPPPQAPTPPVSDTGDIAVLFRHFTASGHAYLAPAKQATPSRAMLWQLSRLLVWGGIQTLPVAEEGETLLPVPDMGVLDRARQKLGAPESCLQAALEAEDFFVTAPFCLDTQHIIHQALLALGPAFAEAASAVAGETANFASRLAGVTDLRFTDGTPFASPQTRTWIQGLNQPQRQTHTQRFSQTAGIPVSVLAGSTPAPPVPPSLGAALQKLESAKSSSLSENLRLNIQQLHLLRENGVALAALPLAEALFLEITGRDLDSWDPALAIETLIAVRNVFVLAPDAYEAELREARRRIARITPAAALE